MSKKIRIEQAKNKLLEVHGDTITLVESTFINTKSKCIFIDKDRGEFEAKPQHVLYRGQGHPGKRVDKIRATMLKTYGQPNASQVESIKEKKKKTCLANYGVEMPLQNSTVRNRQQNTMLEKYGVKFASQNEESEIKKRQTCRERYGVEVPSQNKEIALKSARNSKITTFKNHWKTGEELLCQGSYEVRVVDYLNNNKIDFLWQFKVFMMPNGKSYRPDLFLVKEDKWVEIKGWMRPHSLEKWNWFKTQMPTAEIWNKEKLKEMKIL